MNFLAHLWLAERAQLPLAGAILGDVLRGPLAPELPADLARSVQLHRRLDAQTDRHPRVVAARARFAPGARRYAGIIIDVLFDHVLAQDWARYDAAPLEEFARRSARDVTAAANWFAHGGSPVPEESAFMQLLLSYRSEAGIERALWRTAGRLRRPEGLLAASGGWQEHVSGLRDDLPTLLADLRAASEPTKV